MLDERKLMAYVLYYNTEFSLTMTDIGKELGGVSQPTISRWIKEIEYERQIKDLTIQLNKVTNEIRKKKLINPVIYLDDYDNIE